jgi:hypothetical protein
MKLTSERVSSRQFEGRRRLSHRQELAASAHCCAAVTIAEVGGDAVLRQYKGPESQVRSSLKPNSIAFWENRAAVHYAVRN